MKRLGYPAVYAGAVESCASTGGTLMPPVMGAVAFLMAEFLNVPYSTVMIAALVPALIFYLALLLQVDAYAAVHGLKGLDKKDIPNLWVTLKSGWFYIFSLIALIYMLVWLRWDLYAPYYASGLLIVCAAIFRKGDKRFGLKMSRELIVDSAKIISNIIAILCGVGVIGWSSRIALLIASVGFLYPDVLSYIAGTVLIVAIYGVHLFEARRRPGLP
jgi:TRAP-type uncharacterized transport system fused permease subunit